MGEDETGIPGARLGKLLTGDSHDRTPLIVGLDMGSTNVKAVIYEADGIVVAKASVPAITHYPRPTWAFYDPAELWSLAARVLREATAQVDDRTRIVGIAATSVGESGLLLDADGNPTYEQCIAWFDRRTIAQAEWLGREIGEDALFSVSGLSLQPIFSLNKILWLKEHEPDAFARSVRWLHIADYLAFKLCGVAATDWSLASRTLMFNLRARDWHADTIRAAGLSPDLLAPAMASGTPLDTVTAEVAAETGLPTSCIVAVGGHDHVAGALGAGVIVPGQVLDSMGTAEALFLAMGEPLFDPALGRMGYTQGAHVVPGQNYIFAGLYTSGASVDWAHRLIGKNTERVDLFAAADRTPTGSLGVGFIPHLRLADPPHSDAKARAAFIGLTTDVDQGVLFRAVLEGIAYEARLGLKTLLEQAKTPAPASIAVIGGSAKNTLLLRIKASVMQTPLAVLDIDEATALGAAILAGIGAGVYRDAQDAIGQIRSNPTIVEPEPEAAEWYDRYFNEVFVDLYGALRPLNHRIHALLNPEPPTDP